MKNLGLDTSSFRKLRENNKIYVDKTKWIHNLITQGESYFLSRPRRFGKSLTISTLKELFKGYKGLFKGLYIENKWEFKEYPLFIFDFSGIENSTPEILYQSLREKLFGFYRDYKINAREEHNLSALFSGLIFSLHEKFNEKVVILVDEYDKPILDHVGSGSDEMEIAKKNRYLLKSFFGVLKESQVVDFLQFVFVTGVSRFTKVSIFSEWNNLQDITMHPLYADFLGYSKEEIISYFEDYLYRFCDTQGMDTEECLEKIAFWYNGYRFSPKTTAKVFNPISLMYCLNRMDFDNYWFSTATPSFLVNLLKKKDYPIMDMENLESDLDILETFDIENIQIETLLFQTGYLTIKDINEDFVYLAYPNEEVKKSFTKILMRDLTKNNTTITLAKKLGRAFENKNFARVETCLNEIFNLIPYTLYQKADEKYFHTIIYLALSLSGYYATTEVLTSKGRLDMALFYPDVIYILEFKCNRSAREGLEQIKTKEYAAKYKKEGKKIILCSINFDRNEKKVKKIIFE
ncbi:MAG: ATP-binding protein [Desulfosarcina sp.]|nr:ATP-binding protein [Desulfobacterales bacterium]